MRTSTTKVSESHPLREYLTHAEQWAAAALRHNPAAAHNEKSAVRNGAHAAHPPALADQVNRISIYDPAPADRNHAPAAGTNHSRLKWIAWILSITPAHAPWQKTTSSVKPSSRQAAPASSVYWALAVAVGAILIGLATRAEQPKLAKLAPPPAVKVALANPSAVAPAAAATAAAPATAVDPQQPLFMLMLDPPRQQTPASHDLEVKLRGEMTAAGFPNIGVSVTHYGEVFLAGRVSDSDEKDEILGLVRGTPGVHEIHIDDVEIRHPSGPAYFGVDAAPAPDDIGVKVIGVYKDSPAEVAGIQTGDIITKFGTQYVIDHQSFHYMVIAHEGGQRVAVTILRGGAPLTVMVRLGGASFGPLIDLASATTNQDSMVARSSSR